MRSLPERDDSGNNGVFFKINYRENQETVSTAVKYQIKLKRLVKIDYSINLHQKKLKQLIKINYSIFLDSTKLKIVWIRITKFSKRQVSIIL